MLLAPINQGIAARVESIISDGLTLYVGGSGPDNYTSIQDAINDASDGDTVYVYDDSSPYYEHIVINKKINLKGENRDTTTIIGPGGFYVVLIVNDYVKMSGFSIICNVSTILCVGIQIFSNYTTINDNYITNINIV